MSKHLLKIQPPIGKQKPMKRLNVRACSNPAKQEELQRNITAALESHPTDSFSTTADSQSLTDEWSSLNSSIMKATTDTRRLSTRKHQEWFDNSHPEIHDLLQAKNEAHYAFLRNLNSSTLQSRWKEFCNKAQRDLRRMERTAGGPRRQRRFRDLPTQMIRRSSTKR